MSYSIKASDYVEFIQSKLKTPYVYGAKGHYGAFTQKYCNWLAANYPSVFTTSYLTKIAKNGYVGKTCTDCSGLVCWPWESAKEYGSSQLYSKAYTRLNISKLDDFAVGTTLYKSGHVGVYAGKDKSGNPICIEAKGIDYGTISGIISNPKRWSCGLTYSFMEYDIDKPISGDDVSYKDESKNPYTTPIVTLRKGNTGNGVKWLQWELREAGFNYAFKYGGKSYKAVAIDGDFGDITYAAVQAFQSSCKISVDGIVGSITRKYLTDNTAPITDSTSVISSNPYSVPTSILKYGSKGNDVKWLQYFLNKSCGYTTVAIDGDFGSTTRLYVKKYQTANGLTADGIVGPKTLAKMVS